VAVGHRMPEWINTGFAEYARRLPREMPLELREIKPADRSANSSAAVLRQLLHVEASRIRSALPAGGVTVVLDERGKAMSTLQLARLLERWRQDGRDVTFVIGGADGIDDELKKEADLALALSALTLPHSLCRVLLAEQLYRAASVLAGHPYHRA
jgi:23S rRNA (pseudouridine1915-N3)-methyltransferase